MRFQLIGKGKTDPLRNGNPNRDSKFPARKLPNDWKRRVFSGVGTARLSKHNIQTGMLPCAVKQCDAGFSPYLLHVPFLH